MRPGPWFVLLLLSAPAAAWAGAGGTSFQRRTLVAPSRPGEVPPLELHVTEGLPTRVQLAAPLTPGAVELPEHRRGIQLVRLEDGSLVFAPTRDLAPDERVPFTLAVATSTEPLRFVLVTRREAVDLLVRVVAPHFSAGEEAAEGVARELLAAPGARTTLLVPQAKAKAGGPGSRAQLLSVVWMGRRLFATVAVWHHKKSAPPWKLVQARLRATLADGVIREWPARLLSERVRGNPLHVLTTVLPEGASGLELALDGEGSPGVFKPLSPTEREERP